MKRPVPTYPRLILFLALFLLGQTAKSQIAYTWNGSSSTDWNTPANWTPNGIPGGADNVTIVTGGNICLLNTTTSITNFKLTSGTLDLGGYTINITGATAVFSAGTVQNGALVSTAATTTFGNGPVTMNCTVTINSATVTMKSTSFQKTLTLTKTGASNDGSGGNNIFNDVTIMNNAGSGYLLLGNGGPDQFNAAATFNNTGSSNIYVAYSSANNIFGGLTTFNNTPSANTAISVSQNSAGTIFNDNIIVTSTNGQGVQFGGGATAASVLATAKTISIGGAGFSAGTLLLRQFTQTGPTAQNLTLTGGGNLTFGPAAAFGGDVTASSPTMFLNGCTFSGATNLTKTGATGDNSAGGNVFTGVSSITNSGSSYFLLGSTNPDTWNSDVTFTDNGSERLLPCWASAGNQFQGNIYVNTSGSAQGIQFCGGNTTATATLAASKTILAGSAGLTAGYLYLKQFIQLGSAPINLTATGNSALYLGPNSNFGGAFTASAPDIWAQGAIYNSPVLFTKTGGSSNHNNQYQNIFISTCTINQQSDNGYFMLGYNSNDLFNDTITVTSSGKGGIYLGWTSGTGTPTLAAGKTIMVGLSGFSAGFLNLNTFTQLGNAPMNLNFTGTNTYLSFARNSIIGGDLTVSSPDLFLNGCTFGGVTNLTKTGAGGDYNAGGNIFNGLSSIANSGSGFFVLGNNNPDTWNDDVTFTDNGSERLLPCWGSTGNQFNGNIYVNTSGSAQGIQLCGGNVTATATQAANKTILAGSTGLTAGFLYLKQFTQQGNLPINLTASGTNAALYLGPYSSFGGPVTVSAPDIWAQGATYNGPAVFTKTGGSSNHNNQYQNIFNSSCTINQQSNTGYFMLGYNSNDLFNDTIIVTSSGKGGIYLGWTSGTGTPTLAAGKTILVGAAGFSAGFLNLNSFTQLGNAPISLNFTGTNTYLSFARNSVIGGDLTSNTPDIYFNGGTFNGIVNITKTGIGNDGSNGGNIFQGVSTFTNNGSGNMLLGNGSADTWNNDVTFNNTGSSYIGTAWNSAGNQFNGNIIVSSITPSTGIQFCSNGASTAILAAGKTIQTGAGGFSSGTLLLRQFTQLGNARDSLILTGATTLLQVGPYSAFGGIFTTVTPRIQLNGAFYSDSVYITNTGSLDQWSSGGNTFNGPLTINHLGGGFLGFANGAPDIYNGDVYVNNNSSARIIFGNAPGDNQFNGNIILTQIGASVGTIFGWGSSTDMTLAAGKTISIGAAGFSTGYLQIERFTQLGNVPMNLPLTGNSSLTFGPTSTLGGDLTSTSGSLYFNGCIFNGMVNSTKTGSTNDYSSGNNIFNGPAIMTNAGTGSLFFGNGNRDQFMTTATFTNSGNSNLYVAYNSPNNIFGGVTTFNNIPSANTIISVSQNSAGTIFNDNIVVTSTNGQGIQFCGNTAASATLSAGKTISVGAAGFSAGTLYLRQFTQTGVTPQSLTLTGTGSLVFGPSSAFGGDLTTSSPSLLFNGCNFGGTVTSLKNGSTNDASPGNNTFDGAFSLTNTGVGYLVMGNGNPDLWQSTATFNNLSPAQHMYIAYNSTGNIFNGDVVFNNQAGTSGLWIYANNNGINTQFNGNISVQNVNAAGVYFGNGTGSAVLSSGKSISVGAAGFNAGALVFRNFVQSGGGTTQVLTTTGTSSIQYGPNASFDGPVTSTSPGLFFSGCTFNGTLSGTKTGGNNDQSPGNNIFNGTSTFTNNGTGYLLMTNNTPDAYNKNVFFVQNGTGLVYPNYNNNSTYAGNVTVTSPAATAITFGAGNGTATFSGNIGQNIDATGSTSIPVFTRLVIANTGSGVTLNATSINVSKTLTLSSGFLNTSTTRILTMLNGSTTASGDALSTSYVNGPMRYQKSSSGTTTLNFPIGNAPDCRPVVLTVSHSNGTLYTYQAQLFDIGATTLNYALPPTVTRVSGVHYYTIGRTDASGNNQPTAGLSGNQTIQIFFGTNDYVEDGSSLTVVKNTYTATTQWIDIGGLNGPTYNAGANLTGSITSNSAPSAFNSFSTFALGNKIGGQNILPVGLLYFHAIPDNNGVNLTWSTTSESNNSYFTIEKSKDAVSFESLQRVATKAINGYSSIQLDYTGYDASPYNGVSYYRLKQTDLDGHSTYSPVQAVSFDKKTPISIYPNPTSGPVYVSGIDVNQTSLKAEWYDAGGRLLAQESVPVQGGVARLNPHFNNGLYLLKISLSDGSTRVQNIIILK